MFKEKQWWAEILNVFYVNWMFNSLVYRCVSDLQRYKHIILWTERYPNKIEGAERTWAYISTSLITILKEANKTCFGVDLPIFENITWMYGKLTT